MEESINAFKNGQIEKPLKYSDFAILSFKGKCFDKFEKVFKALDIDKKTKAKEILKAHDCVKYKDISNFDNLKTSLDLIKQL